MTTKEQIIETSKVLYGDILYEQCYDPKKKSTYYLGWDAKEKELITLEFIEESPKKYYPIIDKYPDQNPLETGAVLLPSYAIEYDSAESLQQEIIDFSYKYVDISERHRIQTAYYNMLSHVTEKLNTIPYLRVLGDYGTGKTRYEDVVGGICYKSMFVGGSVKSAPIFRTISTWRGSAIFDEFTLSKSDESEDIIKILNNGFQRGKPVLRCASENYDRVKYFDPFCPKIISNRTSFTDRALESRCITEIMQETDRTDIPTDLPQSFFDKRLELKNKLLMYRFKTWDKIDTDSTVNIDFGHIQPRVKQSFLPFTVLFQYDKNVLDGFIKEVQEYNNSLIEENSTNFDGVMINCYLNQRKAIEPIITAQDIRNDMVSYHGFKDTLNVRTIGRHLKPLGFKSISKTIDKKTYRLLEIDENRLKHLIYRYVPINNQDETLELVLKEKSQKELDVGDMDG